MNIKNRYFNIILISLFISIIAGGSYLLYPKDSNKNPQEIARSIKANDETKVGKKYWVKADRQYKMARKNNKNKLYHVINKQNKVNIDKYLTTFCSENELVVKLQPQANKNIIASRYQGTITNSLDDYGFIVLKLNNGVNKESILSKMKKDKEIQSARACLHYDAQSIPNDTYFNQQWGLKMIQGELSHDVEKLSNIKVAVVDTGVDVNHFDLKGKIIPGYDVVRKTSKVTDMDGHGTHVAGIIAAVTNNKIGISGLTTKIKIMPVGIFHFEGSAGAYMASEDHIAEGIDWARSHGANIINLSLGGGENSPLVAAAVKRAVRAGVTIIAAAGNDGYRKISYPAALPEAIAVGATNQSNELAGFSNYGPELDIVAPGVEIRSTFPMRAGMYLTSSGTSMAAPFVSGLAAMIKAKYPWYSTQQIKNRLQFTATDLGKPGWDPEYGAGLINANEALGGKPIRHPKPVTGDAMEPNNSPATAKDLSYPTSITSNTFGPTSDVDWFKIRGIKGKNIIIRLRTNLNNTSGANGVLELYRDGEYAAPMKASNNSDKGTELINYTFSDDGMYFLKVFDFNDNIHNTDYALDITTIPRISSNTNINNKLANSSVLNLYNIYIPDSNYINIRLKCSYKLDGSIILLDKNKLPIQEWNDAPTGREEIVSFKVKQGNPYFIVVKQVGLDNEDLDYNLAVTLTSEPPRYSSLKMNIKDSFAKALETKYYKQSINKPGKYQASVKPGLGQDLVLQLYKSTKLGRYLITSSDSGILEQPDILTFSVMNKGTYYLGVYDKKGTTSSPYSLLTNYDPTPTISSIKASSIFLAKGKRKHKITVLVNETSNIDLGVYRGNKLVKKIYVGTIDKAKDFYWDGKNTAGKKVVNGQYCYKIMVKDKITNLRGNTKTLSFRKKT